MNKGNLQKMVYFIQVGSDGPVKIGFTERDLAGRLTALQTGNSERLNVAGIIEGGGILLEKDLHCKFSHLRIRGEWFYFGEDLRTYISELHTSKDQRHWVFPNEWSPPTTVTDSEHEEELPISLVAENNKLKSVIRRLCLTTAYGSKREGSGVEKTLRTLCLRHESRIARLESKLHSLVANAKMRT